MCLWASYRKQNRYENKYFFAFLKSMKKGVRDSDPDPDPYQLVKGTDPDPHINVMDPQHCFTRLYCVLKQQVKNKLDDQTYAIKRIRLNSGDKMLNKKIMREVKLLSRLNHENVVRWVLIAPCIIGFIGANALLGPVGGRGPWTLLGPMAWC
jgi:serine/threonine protein kinase